MSKPITPLMLSIKGDIKDGKIWGVIKHSLNDHGYASGWIPFIFDQFTGSVSTVPREIEIPVKFERCYYTEHTNGGRANNAIYSSIQEYIVDPLVKRLYLDHLDARNDIIKQIRLPGNPEHLDYHLVVSYFDQSFQLTEILYDIEPEIFNQWYSEYFEPKGLQLSNAPEYQEREDAWHAQEKVEDLFGDRFFPVAKFDLSFISLDVAERICDHFKGHSKPIIYDNHAYIGIRSKPGELVDGIYGIYEIGGTILIGQEFDW